MSNHDSDWLDPLLQDLIEGRQGADDPDVQARLDADPDLRDDFEDLRSVLRQLDRSGEGLRRDLAADRSVIAVAQENADLRRFRQHALEVGPTRSVWSTLPAVAATLALALGAGFWIRSRPSAEMAGTGYLSGGSELFQLQPLPFGTVQWNPVPLATTYDLYVRAIASDGSEEAGEWLVPRISLLELTWSLPAELLPQATAGLRFELEALDASGAVLISDWLVQQASD